MFSSTLDINVSYDGFKFNTHQNESVVLTNS